MGVEVQATAGATVAAGQEVTRSSRPGSFLHTRPVQCALAVLALIIAAVPALITSMAVWIVLGRPLMFRQIRSGLGGREIILAKFRTMRDLRDSEGRLLPDSERQTPFTRFVRAVRLDEFPQLFSILYGDMDFIGPRPLQPATIASFGPAVVIRGEVRPGLTGWAQVNGNTRLTDWEKVALDIWYIDHRSILLDLRIVLLTAATILTGEHVNRHNLDVALAHMQSRAGGESGRPRGAS